MIVPLKDAARTAQHALRSYQYGNASPELAAEVADFLEENMQAIRMAQEDHPYILEWLARACQDGGGFVGGIARAALVADWENYFIVRPLIVLLIQKYERYKPSEQVKSELAFAVLEWEKKVDDQGFAASLFK